MEKLRYAEMKPRQTYPRVILPELARERPKLGLAYRVTAINEGVPFRYHLIAKSPAEAMMLAKELLPTSKLTSVAQEGEW